MKMTMISTSFFAVSLSLVISSTRVPTSTQVVAACLLTLCDPESSPVPWVSCSILASTPSISASTALAASSSASRFASSSLSFSKSSSKAAFSLVRASAEGASVVVSVVEGSVEIANCPAAFLSYFHCGFVTKYKDHNEQYKSAE